MKTMAIGEIKTHFSQVISEVKKGERKIGILDGKTKIEFMNDFQMTTEELCGYPSQHSKKSAL